MTSYHILVLTINYSTSFLLLSCDVSVSDYARYKTNLYSVNTIIFTFSSLVTQVVLLTNVVMALSYKDQMCVFHGSLHNIKTGASKFITRGSKYTYFEIESDSA